MLWCWCIGSFSGFVLGSLLDPRMSDVERVRAEPPQCGAFFPPRSKECKKATALRGWMVGWLGETTEITVATNRGEQPSSSGSPGTHRQWRQSATNGAHTSFSLPFKRQEQQQQQQHSSAAVASPPSLLHCIDFDSTKNRSPSHHNHRLHPTNSCHCTVLPHDAHDTQSQIGPTCH